MQHQKIKQGYIVLLSTLILSVVGGILILSLYNEQINGTQTISLNINKNKATSLSTACTEQAIYEISLSPYTNVNDRKIDIGNEFCIFSISDNAGVKGIEARSSVNNVISKISVLIDPNSLDTNNKMKILSWKQI